METIYRFNDEQLAFLIAEYSITEDDVLNLATLRRVPNGDWNLFDKISFDTEMIYATETSDVQHGKKEAVSRRAEVALQIANILMKAPEPK